MRSRDSGNLLLHPTVLAVLGILLLNDHYLKANHGGALTGILSDFAGLAFFPILVVCLAEIVAQRQFGPRTYALAAATSATAFALVEMSVPFDTFYETGLGILQSPMRATGLLAGNGSEPVKAVSDPWDLLALPAVALGPWLTWRARASSVDQKA